MPYVYQAALSALAGIVVGLLLIWSASRLLLRVFPSLNKPRFSRVALNTVVRRQFEPEEQPRDLLEHLVIQRQGTVVPSNPVEEVESQSRELEITAAKDKAYDLLAEALKKYRESVVDDGHMKSKVPNLSSEVRANLLIAEKSQNGELRSFQTTVWDTNRNEVDLLPAGAQEELRQAYIDMGLANNLVWLATEARYRSQDLIDGYAVLCGQIAERLNRLMSELSLR